MWVVDVGSSKKMNFVPNYYPRTTRKSDDLPCGINV